MAAVQEHKHNVAAMYETVRPDEEMEPAIIHDFGVESPY